MNDTPSGNGFYKRLGENIKEFRKSKRLTQEKVAEIAGVSRVAFTKIESGKQRLSIYQLYKICKQFNISIMEIFKPAPAHPETPAKRVEVLGTIKRDPVTHKMTYIPKTPAKDKSGLKPELQKFIKELIQELQDYSDEATKDEEEYDDAYLYIRGIEDTISNIIGIIKKKLPGSDWQQQRPADLDAAFSFKNSIEKRIYNVKEWLTKDENNETLKANLRMLMAIREDLKLINAAPESHINIDLHPDTERLFVETMQTIRKKLISSQKKYGYSNDWLTNDWQAECLTEMHRHIKKGDPVDVAIYAMFMIYRKWSTSPDAEGVDEYDVLTTALYRAFQNEGLDFDVLPTQSVLQALHEIGYRISKKR